MVLLCPLSAGIPKAINAPLEFVGTPARRWTRRNGHAPGSRRQPADCLTNQDCPQVEWRRIGAFRNILVHDYLGIDMERIWEIVHRDVPDLKAVVLSMLEMKT